MRCISMFGVAAAMIKADDQANWCLGALDTENFIHRWRIIDISNYQFGALCFLAVHIWC